MSFFSNVILGPKNVDDIGFVDRRRLTDKKSNITTRS